MARLTLCLIARNEEQMLPGCLQSIQGVVDRVVVVDTGSTDRTVEIARGFGAKVLVRPWDDDFSAPRNLAIKSSIGDWILVLDADERLAPGAEPGLRKAMRRKDFDLGLLRLHNANRLDSPTGEVVSGSERRGDPVDVPRLLRRTPDLRYTGVIHETVRDWLISHGNRQARIDADIVHLGGVEAWRADCGKKERNLALLRRRIALEPRDATAYGYLSLELLALGRVAETAEVAERGWSLIPTQNHVHPILRLAMGRGLAALATGDWARALESAEFAIARDGLHPDLAYLRAYALEIGGSHRATDNPTRSRRLEEAVARYKEALELRRRGLYEQILFAEGTEIRARLGFALLALGRGEEALIAFDAAGSGGGEPVLLGRAGALLQLGDPIGAMRLVRSSLERRPDGWVIAAMAATTLGAEAKSAQFMAEARAREVVGFALPHLRAELDKKNGQNEAA